MDAPSAVSLTLENVDLLHAAYMPYLNNGGVFVATDKQYNLGDSVNVQLSLLGEAPQAFTGKVVWITPSGAQGHRAAGIGVEFPDDLSGTLKQKIENILGDKLSADQETHTV